MRRLIATLAVLVAGLAACKSEKEKGRVEPPRVAAVTLRVVYGSEKRSWLEEQVRSFLASGARLSSGRLIAVEAKPMGSGEAMQGIIDGTLQPHVFSPASGAYVALLNRAWLGQAGKARPVCPQGDPLVLSPVVVAMWKPMAEALGWPGKQLGWRDLLKVNAGGEGWGGIGRPEWGSFKLGHTHPEYSNSGLLSVLAEAYAGARKTRGLEAEDLRTKPVRDLVQRVEGTVVHYGKSTGFFAEKMVERGPGYLSAAVLYENLVIESYSKASSAPFPLVAIYPVEGTFWSDHPYAVLDAPWVGADEREAAEKLLAFLKARPQQQRALEHGFRPADTGIPVGAPIDAAHGVDARQPQTLLEVPGAATLEALLALWRETKKAADVILVFDKSGSMAGKPLAEAKAGARAFLDALGDRDRVSVMFFDEAVHPPFGPLAIGTGKEALADRISGAIAGGGTALYDATARAYALALERATKEPGLIHAVVVMTDGKDESSRADFADLRRVLSVEGRDTPVRIFTIGYGARAQVDVLARIAENAQGASARGSVEDIVAVYRDMAAFF
jgi:Ca-activated chloride channel family protein